MRVMNINLQPKKCSGQSRYSRYGSYATGICMDVCAHVCTHVHACLCTVCDNVYLFTYLFACETFLLYMHAVFHNLVADAQP